MIQVRRLDEQDWKTLRDVRLAALADAPHAFWATFQAESRFGQDQWRRFLKAAAWWTASRSDHVVGVVAVLRRSETLDEAELIAMWVAPDERRRGQQDGCCRLPARGPGQPESRLSRYG